MEERPILFSAPMVNAILQGRKTQTRRVVKHKYRLSGAPKSFKPYDCEDGFGFESEDEFVKCPFPKPGGKLWVRESIGEYSGPYGSEGRYCSDGSLAHTGWNYKRSVRPSIHMLRDQCRINLEIKEIRCERLQEITEKDSISEGIQETQDMFIVGQGKCVLKSDGATAQDAFMYLWDSINAKKYPWHSNPWVWVIEFKRV